MQDRGYSTLLMPNLSAAALIGQPSASFPLHLHIVCSPDHRTGNSRGKESIKRKRKLRENVLLLTETNSVTSHPSHIFENRTVRLRTSVCGYVARSFSSGSLLEFSKCSCSFISSFGLLLLTTRVTFAVCDKTLSCHYCYAEQ